MKLFFSIIIPCYNSSGTLPRAVKSVVTQGLPSFEIIIIDDGSSDNTSSIIASLKLKSVKYIRLKRNHGPGYARNVGIKNANGNYIALLDADDYFLPNRLETLSYYLKNNKIDAVADNLFLNYEKSSKLVEPMFKELLLKNLNFCTLDMLCLDTSFTQGNYGFATLKPVFKRDFLLKNKIQYNENLKVGQDFDFLLHFLAKGGRLKLVNKCLYFYNRRYFSNSYRISSAVYLERLKAYITFLKTFKNANLESASKFFFYKHLLNNYYFELFMERKGFTRYVFCFGFAFLHIQFAYFLVKKLFTTIKCRLKKIF